ncbi:hypothetical protein ACSW8S_16405 (plasmid) [Clostridium perfringens]
MKLGVDEWNELNDSDKIDYIEEIKIPIPTNKLNIEIGWKVSEESAYSMIVTLLCRYILGI